MTRAIVQTLRSLIVAALLMPLFAPAQTLTGAATSTSTAASPAAESPLDALRGLLGGAKAQPELLPPDEAFKVEVSPGPAGTLLARLTPAPDYYLYRDRISFRVASPDGISVANVALPKGKEKLDPTFGKVEVYFQPIDAVITLASAAPLPGSVELFTSYQGCNDPIGVCYPPIEKTFTVALAAGGTTASGGAPTFGAAGGAAPSGGGLAALSGGLGGDDAAINELFGGSRVALVAAFFGFGLLLAFTPCMLPMIPILSGIIVGHGTSISKRHALALSAVYVLGMAITYAIAGVAAGLAGTMLSAWLQNPWVLGAFAAIFVLLAMSMFGLYELQLPAALQNRLAAAGSRVKGGKALGAFLMGVLSAVIVGPCVAAPLAGALLYISQTRDVMLGGSALFVMAIGMGVPLMIVGATTGSLLPKAGPWTESVKRVFGVTMLAVAVYMLTPVIPLVVQQVLWAALLIIPAMFLHALDPLPPQAPGHRRLFKGVGVIALLVGAAMLVGAMSGSRDILQPLAGLRGEAAVARNELPFETVRSVAELEQRIASSGGRPVMLDFWAEWCVSCKEMEHFTFTDPRVQARLKDSLLLRADVTANNADDRALLARFALFGPPGIIFFDREGQELPVRVIGYQPADRFLASLDRVALVARAP
ncbi:protein-disulfide reductase DsbD [Piscinibacter sakaiensis]|uniref:protein-disulfide reductase DsbD n=1 Tax=Piscinibacter sakaiensis TaxID=1547922 RepID=UPI003AB0EB02